VVPGGRALTTPTGGGGADLLDWWEGQRRDLPWRATRDPWAVLVCEVMAQQTQVARVAARWGPFLDRFPTPAACAEAPVAELVTWWRGMGYNRRAVNLHRCATAVVTHHGGDLPDDLDALLALPGIGPYTARAVLAFAFERDVGIVDTNAARVLARWSGRRLTARQAQTAADLAVPPGRAWAWNQAVLDLAASVCVRRSPRCDTCPVTERCAWRSEGWPLPDPADGSAGVSGGQSRFEGSDRQGRGRLLDALREGPVPAAAVPASAGWPDDPDRATRVVAGLVADGLATWHHDTLHLP
jgi:A/G-specific adenine glycosylase